MIRPEIVKGDLKLAFLLFLLSNVVFVLSQKWKEVENSAIKKVNNIFDLLRGIGSHEISNNFATSSLDSMTS